MFEQAQFPQGVQSTARVCSVISDKVDAVPKLLWGKSVSKQEKVSGRREIADRTVGPLSWSGVCVWWCGEEVREG